jgi:hypothetical protein
MNGKKPLKTARFYIQRTLGIHFLLALSLLLSACGPNALFRFAAPTATPTGTATPLPTATMTRTSTPTPTLTPSATVTPIPSETPTRTLVPSDTPSPTATTDPNLTPTQALRTSKPGYATITGRLVIVNPHTLLPADEDPLFLVVPDMTKPDYAIPPFKIGEVPRAEVDETDGRFVFTDVEPGTYLIAVMAKNGTIFRARIFSKDDLAIVKVTQSGQTIDVGNITYP